MSNMYKKKWWVDGDQYVAVRTHAHVETNLCQKVEILQARALAEIDAMRDILRNHESGREVVYITRLARVWPE